VTGRAAVALRTATAEDLDVIVEHTWAVAAEGRFIGIEVPFDRDLRRERLAAILAGPSSTILVAEAAGHHGRVPVVVGHISVDVSPYGVADIGMLLADGWRGMGIGTALLDAAISWSEASGAHKMALEVWPDNGPAIGLYRRAGFVEEGRKLRHYRRRSGELWDSVLMGRPLTGA
jgi:ribosomal protein S18 acetylase RimI-like enzyme